MSSIARSPGPYSPVDERVEPSPGWWVQLLTALFSAWVLAGLFLDGWAHTELPQLETFFTPWHAILYSGLLVTAGWIAVQSAGGYRRGRRGLRAIPFGYGLGLVGAGLFCLAGLADLAWHTAFGIESSLAALLSPPHLLLGLAAALMISTPARSVWRSGGGMQRPSFGEFLPVLLSVTLLTVAAAFFLAYANAFHAGVAALEGSGASAARVGGPEADSGRVLDLTRVLITTVMLMLPLLAMLARWRLPIGAATLLFTAVAAFSTAEHGFEASALILPAAIGGVVADALAAVLRPSPERAAAFRVVASVVPATLWLAYFAVTALTGGLAWPAELWTGTIVLSAFTGFGLSLLVAPPAHLQGGTGGDPVQRQARIETRSFGEGASNDEQAAEADAAT